MRIFLTGGSGLVGTRLIKRLLERGDTPVLLTRSADKARKQQPSAVEIVEGNPAEGGPWMESLQSCDAVINLVGEGIFNKRWNDEFKEEMRRSRVVSTHNVVTAMSRQPKRSDGAPKVLVSASAIGIYGPHGDEELDESSPAASDFLAQLCVEWEKATMGAALHGIRAVCVRVGVVLDPNGGALAKLLPPFKMFVGGPVGSGGQYMSWIHHEDLVGILLHALDRAAVDGPVNGTAPNPVTNKEFSKALGAALGRPSFMPTPAFMLRLMLGEVAGVVTQGQRVLPRKALDTGYRFKFTHIDAALADLLRPST
jgi:uncharacterized protein (TIGR01777 family)